jgi:hypothetical protein
MRKNTKFNEIWLHKTDSDGVKLGKWLRRGEKVSSFDVLYATLVIWIVPIEDGVPFHNI